MKVRLNDIGRALAGMPLLAASLAVAAAIGAEPLDGARAGSEPDLWPEGLRAGSLRPEGLVSALRAEGAEIVTLGSRGGLDGYLVMPAEGAGYSLYVTENGHAVAGLLYGPDGMEITGAQLAAARPAAASAQRGHAASPQTAAPATAAHAESEGAGRPSSSPSLARLFQRTAAAFGFTLGRRGPVVVLLGDATCSFSRSAAARLGRAALDGRLQLRVVPVAVLGGAAARRAAAIAADPDPARAWFEGGGTANRTGAGRIARNNALLDEWGATAVPLIAWSGRGGTVGHRIGDFDDVGAWLMDTLRVGDTRAGDGHE
ncbi:MAG: hypothetical protein OXN81_21395 [Alphaproteobacteria bacterium]|nr:hypothetical protein [Alphaproteobacteria bacterium]